jgi:hypothetical protein
MLKNIQYITDANGRRLALVVPLDDYRELLESMDMIPAGEQSDPRRSTTEIMAELIANGKLVIPSLRSGN